VANHFEIGPQLTPIDSDPPQLLPLLLPLQQTGDV
jgi:hypothetical protein